MNERIKECWLTAARQDCGDKWDTQEEFIERFAKLIVQECVGLVNEQLQHNNPNDSLLALKIKEHFGVE